MTKEEQSRLLQLADPKARNISRVCRFNFPATFSRTQRELFDLLLSPCFCQIPIVQAESSSRFQASGRPVIDQSEQFGP